jgi:cyclase
MMQHIEVMESRNIDELIILDIVASKERREPLFNEIKQFTSRLFCPVTIGGGISSLDHAKRLIQECGADKIAIKSNPRVIPEIANKFGAQAIVGVCDYTYPNRYYGKSISWLITKLIRMTTGMHSPVGEILLTSMARNGTKLGYDEVPSLLNNSKLPPIVVNGGCGEPAHMLKAFQQGANACAASSMFLFTEWTPRDCAKYLQDKGIGVRVDA